MNNKLAIAAREALAIQERGWYKLSNGTTVSIEKALNKACDNTCLYLPEDFDPLWAELSGGVAETTITIENRSTLEAARQLRTRYERVGLLNFASARNPGGGFLGGARAQEESLARASGLYTCLRTQPGFYECHRELRSCLYSDRVIFAPEVPAFCDDDHRALAQPYTVSMLTSAAVNVGALERNEPQNLRFVEAVMARRIRMVLAVAATQKIEALVLGAWGCGVFRCDPELVARLFAEALAEPKLQGLFRHLVFAIMNPRSGPDKNISAFERHFSV